MSADPRSVSSELRTAALRSLKSGDLVAAAGALEQAAQLSPDLGNLRLLTDVLYRLDRTDEARAVFTRAYAEADRRLPTDLAAALRLGQDRSHWSDEQRFAWGRKAIEVIRHWVFLPQRPHHTVEALVDAPPWLRLTERLPPGRGAVLVDTHIGLPFLAYPRLLHAGLPARLVVANSEVLLTYPSEMTVNVRAGSAATLLQLRAALRQGALVHIVGDGGIGRKAARRSLNGYAVDLPLGPATLAYAARAPIFWHASLWRGDRIEVQLMEGPRPAPSEGLEAWRQRWLDFYWTQMQAALASGPENLDRKQFDAMHGGPGDRRA